MPVYLYRVELQGATPGDKSSLTFNLGDLVDEPAALIKQSAIRSALIAVTLANIRRETLINVLSEDNQLPAAGDTYERAVVACHLNAPAEAEKIHNVYIPAPEALFEADGQTVDKTDAELVAYIQALADNALVSDGEAINTASGTNGIKDGYKSVRQKSFA